MKPIDPIALFRLSVLGPLVSREQLHRGELQHFVRELAQREYDIPGSRRRHVGEKTIEAWFYAYRRGGLDALTYMVDSYKSGLTNPNSKEFLEEDVRNVFQNGEAVSSKTRQSTTAPKA